MSGGLPIVNLNGACYNRAAACRGQKYNKGVLVMDDRMEADRFFAPRIRDLQRAREILDGNLELWDTLYRESYAIVLREAARADGWRLLGQSDYRDITDEAYARCFSQLDRYEGRSRFAGWVAGYARNITRNRCTRELTRRRYQPTLNQRAEMRMTGRNPVMTLIRLEQERCVMAAFFYLPEKERRIVAAQLFEEKKTGRIAREMRLTRKEVESRYHIAISVLRKQFIHYYYCVRRFK